MLLQIERLQLVTDGVCKDNTSQDPFSQFEQLQGIHIQVKSEYVGTLTTIEQLTRKQSDKHNNMFNVVANLKHLNTHENNNWRLVSALSLFVCSVSSQLLLFSLSVEWFLVHTPWIEFVPCSFHRHRHVSCARRVAFSPTSLFTSLSFSSFPLSSCTSYCLSPSSSLMSWTTTTRTAAEELGPQDKKSSTNYEPKDHFLTEAFVEFIQESVTEQHFLKTSTTTTSPSVRRSSMRAADEPITLKEKACRPVCRRRQWVMIEQWHPLSAVKQVTRKVTTFRDKTLKANKSGLFWTDKWSKSLLIVKRRCENTNSRPIMAEEVSKFEWSVRVSKRNLSSSSRRRTTSTRSSTSPWTVIEAKLGSSWSSWEKSRWDGRIEAISGLYIRYAFEKKIARRSRYYPWTHRQDSGITEWN